MNKANNFLIKLKSGNFFGIANEWDSLPYDDKCEVHELLKNTDPRERDNIRSLLNVIDENLATSIFENKHNPLRTKIVIDGTPLSLMEIKDKCIMNPNFVVTVWDSIDRLTEKEREMFFFSLKEFDEIFFTALKAGYDRFKADQKSPTPVDIEVPKFEKKLVDKESEAPNTKVEQYGHFLQEKARLLGDYHISLFNKLKDNTLVNRLVQLEAQNIFFEDLK